MRKCSGFVGNPKESAPHLIPRNKTNLPSLRDVRFFSQHAWIQFILWPGASLSLSLSFISFMYNAQTSAEEKKQLIDLHCRFCKLDFESWQICLYHDVCKKHRTVSPITAENWPQNSLKSLPDVWIILAKKHFPPGGRHRRVLSNGVNVQTISSPANLVSHAANEHLILIKWNKQICATVALRPEHLLWP